ncbi:dihydrolipoyl dehydrogenase family protein [Halodesulfovibrio marinisediminis]|uniref:Pyruvate/2-oxoglutarate dehydrogenase complex, dihydrolipoamide dehydrogenase (E3) component n=1 Tax=Halodesulfovibrio marinisediminis DSM 17456 TaxID=1121457 RepID=A0A1N6ICV7_9BACT|nr:FAD-dependent oxidoreductase [Halodesulfovibrio marinisediminis]SIO29847.1 Pyruvate/2-oxoglutarate dehydrogenase complex, dihydrolipoamide dehydrogenase (E3) component [Halodesulfovibrio marinisediminis DSM 17456]
MAEYDFDLIIIGSGAAGLTVASGAAQLGVKVLLIEKEKQMGGDCLHYGCVPSKTLIKCANVRHQMANAESYGLPAPALEPVDFSKVSAHIKSVVEKIQPHDSPERFESLGAVVRFGTASFVDSHTIALVPQDGKTTEHISGKNIVIAAGSTPSTPPFKGLDQVDYLTNETVFFQESLPPTLTVIGGGPIAVEMAQAFQRLGSKVTLLQRSAHILSKEDPDMASVVEDTLRKDGVNIITNTNIAEIFEEDGKISVLFGTKEHPAQKIASDRLLVALGRTPSVKTLVLENAGVKYSQKGIPVDDRMRTNVPHIYAVGDITGKYQFTHAAGYEGGIVIANAVFKIPRKANYSLLPWVTYCDPELASIGYNEKRAKEAGITYSIDIEKFTSNDRALAENKPEGKLKLLQDAKGRVIGVQIVGIHAGELINEWVAILGGNVKLATLAGAIHPYPTLGEINKKVAGTILSKKVFSPFIRKILRTLFKYRGKA